MPPYPPNSLGFVQRSGSDPHPSPPSSPAPTPPPDVSGDSCPCPSTSAGTAGSAGAPTPPPAERFRAAPVPARASGGQVAHRDAVSCASSSSSWPEQLREHRSTGARGMGGVLSQALFQLRVFLLQLTYPRQRCPQQHLQLDHLGRYGLERAHPMGRTLYTLPLMLPPPLPAPLSRRPTR